MLFFGVLLFLSVVAGLVVAVPLMSTKEKSAPSRNELNAMIFQERKKELRLDLKTGFITREEYSRLKAELELNLLHDIPVAEAGEGRVSDDKGKLVPLVLLAFIPLSVIAIYSVTEHEVPVVNWLQTQSQVVPLVDRALQGLPLAENNNEIEVSFGDFIRGLQVSLQKDTGNHNGWYLLGRSYLRVKLPEHALMAMERALQLSPSNEEYQLGLVQALLAGHDGVFDQRSRSILNGILKRDPDNVPALMTFATASFGAGDYGAAVSVWEKLLVMGNGEGKGADVLRRRISMAKEQMGIASAVTHTPPEAGIGGESPQDPVFVDVTVNIAAGLKSGLKPDDTLFVYARAVSGPPMPLAVVKYGVGNWPVTVQLSDKNAIMEKMALSKFERVTFHATISHSGNATPQTGDFLGKTGEVRLGKGLNKVALIVDRKKG